MKLFALLPCLQPLYAVFIKKTADAPPVAPPDDELVCHEPAEERLLGCGWFDSSHELQHGLQVREHATADSLGTELPLRQWLELTLASHRVTQAA